MPGATLAYGVASDVLVEKPVIVELALETLTAGLFRRVMALRTSCVTPATAPVGRLITAACIAFSELIVSEVDAGSGDGGAAATGRAPAV